jgi:hypothetical protein
MLTRIKGAAADVLETPADINLAAQPAERANRDGLHVARAQTRCYSGTAFFAGAFASDLPLTIAGFHPVAFFKTAETCFAHG